MLEQVAQVFDPDGDVPPLAPILALELCPDWALPWLAQWVGIRIPSGMSATDARALIGDVSGFARGTPASLRAAVQTTLTDSKTVWFRERDGSPYRLEVVTLTSETPDAAKRLHQSSGCRTRRLTTPWTCRETCRRSQLRSTRSGLSPSAR
jgi:hypothetical protein